MTTRSTAGTPATPRTPAASRTPAEPRTDVVTAYGTGLLTTEVRATEDGFLWLRAAGPAAPSPFRPSSEALRTACAAIGEQYGARLVMGQETAASPGVRRYRAGDRESAAHYLLLGGPDAVPGGAAALERALRGVGALLAALHATPVPPAGGSPVPSGVLRPARGLERLHAWLTGDSADSAAPARGSAAGAAPAPAHSPAGSGVPAVSAAELLGARMSAVAQHALRAWCAEALAVRSEAEPAVLSHGAPGLGSLVPAPRSGTAALLTGEDLCLAPWQYDLGWIVGELVEMRWAYGGQQGGGAWQRLLDALADGYGRGLGDQWHRWAALRVVLHAHDTLAYTTGGERTAALYAALAARLVEGGAR
ncbi:hypothetical protein [Streptomyces sp. URMC 123]|uniref:hypothetical protein n=1 Tax=Streptomyces sp. URMC 123 TaxID=3423403 RepID=UPI003F1CF863